MKRFFVVLFLIVLVGAGGTAWWLLRDSPDKVIRDAVTSLTALQGADRMTLDVAVTDPQTRVTGGLTFVGRINASDLSHVQALGVVQSTAPKVGATPETVDVVMSTDTIALRPVQVDAEQEARYQALAQDPSHATFIRVDRDGLLKKYGYGVGVAHASDASIREALRSIGGIPRADGGITASTENGRDVLTVPFHLDVGNLRAWFITAVRAWTGAAPTPEAYGWIDRIVNGAGHGSFQVTIDSQTRSLVRIEGSWRVVDNTGSVLSLVHAVFETGQADGFGPITIPQGALDVSDALLGTGTAAPSGLPGSATRAEPLPVVRPTTPSTPQIDLFSTYQEEIRNKKNVY